MNRSAAQLTMKSIQRHQKEHQTKSDLPNPVGQVRKWIKEEIESERGFSQSELAQKILDRLQGDIGALRALAYPGILQEIRCQLSTRRNVAGSVVGERFMTRAEMQEKGDRLLAKWHGWYEITRDGREIPLMQMNKAQIGEAITIRTTRIAGELHSIKVLETLYALMADDQTVNEKFTVIDLEQIEQGLLNPTKEEELVTK